MPQGGKKILIINGHPYKKSLNHALAQRYAKGARAGGHDVRVVHLHELSFDPVLRYGYHEHMEMEPDLASQQDHVAWCEHFVIVTPVWWMARPSLLQGYLERVFTPEFAYRYRESGLFKFVPQRLLKGRSARVIYTQGGPQWALFLLLRDSFWLALKRGVLMFSGMSPVRRTCFSRADHANAAKRAQWLAKVEALGRRGA